VKGSRDLEVQTVQLHVAWNFSSQLHVTHGGSSQLTRSLVGENSTIEISSLHPSENSPLCLHCCVMMLVS
jgi:hypothetical protein